MKINELGYKKHELFCNAAENGYICSIMKICVFCSANSRIDAEYHTAAAELGRRIGEGGHSLVFGGTDLGLMEAVAQAARQAGATVIGVVPTRVEERGRTSRQMDVHIPCDNLGDRKALMMAQSDVFVALPGGIGTLDEVFTVAASASIGYHSKPVILCNVGGFWDSLITMLDNLDSRGALRDGWRGQIMVAGSVDETMRLIGK